MTLVTCSSYSTDVYRLFDTFRQHNPNDKIVWILADKQPLSISDSGLIREYFGNIEIIFKQADDNFWRARPCLHHPQWEAMAQIAHKFADNETILRCDANDVVIQKQCAFGDIPDNHIFCGYEGMLYKDNPCCLGWFDNAKKETYKDFPVINSGVLVMNGKTFKTLTADMGYGNNPGIYCDQNGVNWTCDKLNIKLINHPEILAAYNNKFHINNHKIHHNSKMVTVAHFNGRHMFEYLRNAMQELFSTEQCQTIEKQILGYNMTDKENTINHILETVPLVSPMLSINEAQILLEQLYTVLGNNIEGDIVELGCNCGTTSVYLQALLEGTDRKLFLYDSFDGLPDKVEQDETEHGYDFIRGSCTTSEEYLKNHLKLHCKTQPTVIKGWFRDIPDEKYPNKIAFAFFDGDFYSSIIDSFEKVYHKLSKGAIVCIHDYEYIALPGVIKACADFLKGKPEEGTIIMPDNWRKIGIMRKL